MENFYIYVHHSPFSSLFLSLSPSPTMASQFSLRINRFSSYHLESLEPEETLRFKASYTSVLKVTKRYCLSRNNPLHRFLFTRGILLSQCTSLRCYSPKVFSTMSPVDSDKTNAEDEQQAAMANTGDIKFNRINCLVWVLHESARSFSLAIQTLELGRSDSELAMAWVGVDVHSWHKRIAYQVAVYALLKAAIEVELFLSHKRSNNSSSVSEIFYTKTIHLGECIEAQLNMRHPKLVHWFKMVELPRIAGLFIPLFKKWSMEYAGSGVAGIILAISCCTAIRKLGSGRISCPSFSLSIEDTLVELMNLSHSLVSVDKLHHLATEAGFEDDFLMHFGRKVLPSKNAEDTEFWIGLVQKKLSVAFSRESLISGNQVFGDKVQENNLAILGLFAFLARDTRLCLSRMNMKDHDEQVMDFLSYLECGILFVYPEFSSLPEYQLFMEIVTDEIGWLDFYAEYNCKFYQEKRRSKKHTIQAEKEIILYTIFTVCYDVFSGFAHFSSSTRQPLESKLLAFLLRGQSLLSICLEDYWAAYDKSGEPLKNIEGAAPTTSFLTIGTENSSGILEAQRKPIDLLKGGSNRHGSRVTEAASTDCTGVTHTGRRFDSESKLLYGSFLKKSTTKLISASSDIWMGTRLLWIDVLLSLKLIMKKLRGQNITERERRKIERTLADIVTLVPVTILMLIPVSAVGHAAMLAAIKQYIPSLIPSPYSSERLNLVKQLNRTKKMEVQSWRNVEDTALFSVSIKEIKEDEVQT